MNRGAFQERSGRVIAVGRSLLALFFLAAISLEPSNPSPIPSGTYPLLGAYAAFALLYLLLTWNNWWLESRLGGAAHVIDLLALGLLNLVTKGYASPFFTFFVFLILSASIRWGWRETALTAAAITILYLVEGVASSSWGTHSFHFRRFMIRSSYLIVLSSMVMLWFASNQQAARFAPMLSTRRKDPTGGGGGGGEADGAGDAGGMEDLLSYAVGRFGCRSALLIWSGAEEPWTYAARVEDGRFEQRRFEPGRFEPAVNPGAGAGPFIFDQKEGRVLRRRVRRRSAFHLAEPLHPLLAAEFALTSGIRIPVRSGAVRGDLFVGGVSGLCSDDLNVAEEATRQVELALDDAQLFQATQETAGMRARLALARDIHDGVVQFLAGLNLRLEGVRKAANAGRAIDADIDALQGELVGEQQELRRYLEELRSVPQGESRPDLAATLRQLVERMACQWSISCTLEAGPGEIPVSHSLQREVLQMVREAVANAVRHGGASAVVVLLTEREGLLDLVIRDDGTGFPVHGAFAEAEMSELHIRPRSLHERVQSLGGTLGLDSTAEGSRVTIALPPRRA